MKYTEASKLVALFQNFLDSSKYLVYEDSLKIHDHYSIINYQSKSVVLHGEPDDHMAYGIGVLMYRHSDEKIIYLDSLLDVETQIALLL